MGKKRRRRSDEGGGENEDSPSKVFIMDETVAEYIRRTVLRIPRSETSKILARWGFLSEKQLESLNIHQQKEDVANDVVEICEENCATIKHAADLDIVYNYTYRNKKIWTVCRLTREEDEKNSCFNLEEFKKKFEKSLHSALKNVTINFSEYEDNAIWIRIAWGSQYKKPNQYKPSYVVHHSQTPYVFVSNSIYRSCKHLLFQALLAATGYDEINEMDLRSHCLDSLKDIVLKKYSQTFQTHYIRPLQEKSSALEKVDPRIIQEDKREKERIQRVNDATFGDYPQPKLEFAQYKLETVLKNEQGKRIWKNTEPFRCLVKFSSPHLLEALKALAPAGIADAPLSPLLTCITQKAQNYFKIKERKSVL